MASTISFADEYTMGKELGRGAFSVVYQASRHADAGAVAVKKVNKKAIAKKDLEALELEIGILKEINHPHVLTLLDTYEDKGNVYLVTDLIQGGELFDRITAK